MTTYVSPAQAVLDAQLALQTAAAQLGLGNLPSDSQTLLIGQAWAESFFGRAVTGYDARMRGSNNWGSVDSTPDWEKAHAGQDAWGKFAHTDTMDGTQATAYVAWFRIYPNQLEAARGFLKTAMYGNPGAFLSALAAGAATYAHWLKVHGYYGVSEGAYASMLSGASGTVNKQLTIAAGQGLTAADPTSAGYAENDVPPVAERVLARLLPNVHPPEGVVWFGKPPSAGPGIAGAAVIGVCVFLVLALTGVVQVHGPLGRLLR